MTNAKENKTVLESLPDIDILGGDLDLYANKKLRGKFVVTQEGKFFAKLFPAAKFDGSKYFHNNILEELGIKDAASASVKELMAGGGKIDLELVDDYVECRLFGSSQNYGDYDSELIDTARLETAVEAQFNLGMMPILVIPDFEK